MTKRMTLAVMFGVSAILVSAAFSQSQSPPKTKTRVPTAAQVRKSVAELDDDNYFVRQRATRMLVEAGAVAVPLVTETALKGSSEAATRAMTVLAILVDAPDAKTAAAAEKGLRRIAASKNEMAARRAAFLLRGPNRLRTMHRLLRDVRITVSDTPRKTAAALKTDVKKLYRFSDKARTHMDGGLSVWTHDGRPTAFVKLWTIAGEERRWGHGFISAAATGLNGEMDRKLFWTPASASPQRAAIPKAADPAKTKAERLKQMTALAQRFTAREFWEPGRTEYKLSLRTEPILRFVAEKTGVLDGAVFVYCHDSNPEAILVLEAARGKDKKPRYQYSVFRGGDSELHVELDGEEIMVRPRTNGAVGEATDVYRVQIRTLTADSEPPAKARK